MILYGTSAVHRSGGIDFALVEANPNPQALCAFQVTYTKSLRTRGVPRAALKDSFQVQEDLEIPTCESQWAPIVLNYSGVLLVIALSLLSYS